VFVELKSKDQLFSHLPDERWYRALSFLGSANVRL
jgi:hypothetical protein